MEDMLQNMIRILVGVVSLACMLWGAMKYMVNYTVHRAEERNKARIERSRIEARAEARSAQKAAEKVEYKLDAHLQNEHPKLEARVRNLEKRAADKS